MSKLSTLDNPLERISGTDKPKENPFKERSRLWESLGTPLHQGRLEDSIRSDKSNPFG